MPEPAADGEPQEVAAVDIASASGGIGIEGARAFGRLELRILFPMVSFSLLGLQHPEPNGSRRATPTSTFQHRPGHLQIGGTVELQSTEGKGTVFTIKIPLTLAIVSAALTPPTMRFIIVTQVEGPPAGAHSFGIIVDRVFDRVFDTEEIVVKPVAPILRDIPLFSGNTILGDGSVIMILDPNGIAAQSGEMSVSESPEEENQVLARNANEKVTMLIFRAVDGAPKAVPLALVARLEEFDVEVIEQSNWQALVQYRGQLMPLVLFNDSQTLRDTGRQPVLVFTDDARTMGLVVDEIVDIIETELVVNIPSEVPGMIGSAIIAGKATDVVDTSHYLTQAYPDWFKTHGNERFGEDTDRLLLVDDSAFFRNMLAPLLQVAGYNVTTVGSATEALDLCEAGAQFDLIISDIEMPGMSGFEFAEKIRSDSAWKDVPVVALTSHTAPQDIDRGREVGFTDYVGKSDRDALLRSVSETLAMARSAA